MPKILTLLGTRPEIIRLSVLINRLDAVSDHILVNTRQNFAENLNKNFFVELGIREPNYELSVSANNLHEGLADMFRQFGDVLEKENPEVVVVLGDTNTSLVSLLAKRRKIPVYHIEAGNRSFDENVPEEVNRRIVDSFSDFNLCYSARSMQHLFREGSEHRRVAIVGSPLPEVVEHYKSRIDASEILQTLNLEREKFIVASFHRQENVDDAKRLSLILESLRAVSSTFDLQIIVSTHPRTQSRLAELQGVKGPGVRFIEALGFFDYLKLQSEAFCVISDSGSISEEAAALNLRAITIRESMERPEALDAGTVIMSGLAPRQVVDAVRIVSQSSEIGKPSEYQTLDFSERVVRYIFSTWHLSSKWHGYN